MKSVNEYPIDIYGLTTLSLPRDCNILDVVNGDKSLFVCVEEESDEYFKDLVDIFVFQNGQTVPYNNARHIRSVRIQNETVHVYEIK